MLSRRLYVLRGTMDYARFGYIWKVKAIATLMFVRNMRTSKGASEMGWTRQDIQNIA